MNTLRLLLVVPALLAGASALPAQGVVLREQPRPAQESGDRIAQLMERAQKAYAQGKTQEAAEMMAKAQAMMVERAERQEVERRVREAHERAQADERRQAQAERRRRTAASDRQVQEGRLEDVTRHQEAVQEEVERMRRRVAELEAELMRRRAQAGPQGPSVDALRVSPPNTGGGAFYVRPQGDRQGAAARGPQTWVATPRTDAAPQARDAAPRRRAGVQQGLDAGPQRRAAAPQAADATQRLLRGIHEELKGIRKELSGIRKSLSHQGGGLFGSLPSEPLHEHGTIQWLQQDNAGQRVLLGRVLDADGSQIDALLHVEAPEQVGDLHAVELDRLHEGLLELQEVQEIEQAIQLEVETLVEELEDGSRQLRVIAVPPVETGGAAGGAGGNVRYRVLRGAGAGTVLPPEPVRPSAPAPLPPAPPVEEPTPQPTEQPQPDASSAFLPSASTAVEAL